MGRILAFTVFPLIAISGICLLLDRLPSPASIPLPRNPGAIVSLSPAITSTLVYLGLSDKIVGATRFCQLPPGHDDIARVGGFLELNPEAIIKTSPDLVIIPTDLAHYQKLLENLGIPVMVFETRTLQGYLKELASLLQYTGETSKGMELINSLNPPLKTFYKKSAPSIIFAIPRSGECLQLPQEITIIGNDGFYNELIQVAEGQNAYDGHVAYPAISREALIMMDPDVIIMSCPSLETKNPDYWSSAPGLKAVRNGKAYITTDPDITIPGPGALKTLQLIKDLISDEGISQND